MLAYNRADEAYVQSIVKYMSAGIASGQMCICAVLDPVSRQIKRRMKSLGVSLTSGQFLMPDAESLYAPGGRFDLKNIIQYWRDRGEIAATRWNGVRAFGDFSSALENRAFRLKTLEYEAIINSAPGSITVLCGYQTSTLPRGYLRQVCSLHPYIASSKSMRVNRDFVETDKFLAGLYRFRRVSKVYLATLDQVERVGSDLEDAALRTGMTMPDMDVVKEAICGVFAMVAEALATGAPRSHVHLVYDPKPNKFSVTLRYHHALLKGASPQWDLPQAWKTMDTVHIGESGPDATITMTKRYWSYLNGTPSTS